MVEITNDEKKFLLEIAGGIGLVMDNIEDTSLSKFALLEMLILLRERCNFSMGDMNEASKKFKEKVMLFKESFYK